MTNLPLTMGLYSSLEAAGRALGIAGGGDGLRSETFSANDTLFSKPLVGGRFPLATELVRAALGGPDVAVTSWLDSESLACDGVLREVPADDCDCTTAGLGVGVT